MQVFFILFSVHFAVYQYINSKCLYRTHVKYDALPPPRLVYPDKSGRGREGGGVSFQAFGNKTKGFYGDFCT